MTSTTIYRLRNHREENAELWDLLRRSQSRLANIKTKTPEYDTDTTTDDYSCSDSEEGGNESIIIHGDDNVDDYDEKNNEVQVEDYDDDKSTEENEEESSDKTTEKNEEESRNDDEKLRVRDYEQEHREVLYLLEQSKQRLSKTRIIVVVEDEESVTTSDGESSCNGTNCWDDDGALSLSSNGGEGEEASVISQQKQVENIFDMKGKDNARPSAAVEATPSTAMESSPDDFDDFFEEDFEIAYTHSHDTDTNEAKNDEKDSTNTMNLEQKMKSALKNASDGEIMIATDQQEEDGSDWDWDEDEDSSDEDDQATTPLKSLWHTARNAIAEVASPEPEEEDNFFNFFDKQFDSTFGSNKPNIAIHTNLRSEKDVEDGSSTIVAKNIAVVAEEEEEDFEDQIEEEEDNFFEFFDKKFDATFGSKEPKIARANLKQINNAKSLQGDKPLSMTASINKTLVEAEKDEEIEDSVGPLSMLWGTARNAVKTAVRTVAEEFNELDKTMESNASDISHILEDDELNQTMESNELDASHMLEDDEEELDFMHDKMNTSESNDGNNLINPVLSPKKLVNQSGKITQFGAEQVHDYSLHSKQAARAALPEPSTPRTKNAGEREDSVEDDLKSLSTFLWSSIPKSWSQLQEMGDEAANILSET